MSFNCGGVSAGFVYDGDGNRVKATFNGTVTVYIEDGQHRPVTCKGKAVPKALSDLEGLFLWKVSSQ